MKRALIAGGVVLSLLSGCGDESAAVVEKFGDTLTVYDTLNMLDTVFVNSETGNVVSESSKMPVWFRYENGRVFLGNGESESIPELVLNGEKINDGVFEAAEWKPVEAGELVKYEVIRGGDTLQGEQLIPDAVTFSLNDASLTGMDTLAGSLTYTLKVDGFRQAHANHVQITTYSAGMAVMESIDTMLTSDKIWFRVAEIPYSMHVKCLQRDSSYPVGGSAPAFQSESMYSYHYITGHGEAWAVFR